LPVGLGKVNAKDRVVVGYFGFRNVLAKKIPPIPVTQMPLAKANEALVDLQKGRLVGRAVLTP